MIVVNGPRVRYLFSLFIVIFLLLSGGCERADSGSQKQDKAPLLLQNLSFLKNSNGKIFDSQVVNVKSKWSDNIDCYKVRYLSDGLQVVGFVLRPKSNAVKYPAMIFNRGGNQEVGKITNGKLNLLSYFCSKNYVVLASQYRGNDGGEGEEDFGGKDVDDVLNIIELAKSLPFVEPDKIVMVGISRGGMMTYLAMKQNADIKAAAVVGGVTDLEQTYYERDVVMKNVIRELVGMNKSEWGKRSAIYWPEKINAPTLILHGEYDRKVNVSQAIKLSEKLTQAGKVYELVVFQKGDHSLKTHISERNQKILEWFEKYLNNN